MGDGPDPPRLLRPVTDEATSKRLGRVRQRGTTPELTVRRIVRSLGARYTVANRDLPGSPDLANRRRGWAIFVHGCFWHAHQGCARATMPKRNREFWQAKFEANRRRDLVATEALQARGLRVLTLWECELLDADEVRAKLLRSGIFDL